MSSQRRWSLRALSLLPKGTPETARILLRDVTDRLMDQYQACQLLKQGLEEYQQQQGQQQQQQGQQPLHSQQQQQHRLQTNLNHLTLVQYDTFQQTQQLLLTDRQRLLQRWSAADQFYVTALMKQTRDRHAPALERWVELATDYPAIVGQQEQQYHDDPTINGNSHHDHHPHHLLDRMMTPILQRRIGIQLLTDHYDRLQKEYYPHGAVQRNKPLVPCLYEAYQEAQAMAEVHLLATPEMVVRIVENDNDNHNDTHQHNNHIPVYDIDDDDINNEYSCTVVRSWLHHALVEVFKNAIQATVERVQQEQSQQRVDSSQLPPLQVTIRRQTAARASVHLAAQQPQPPTLDKNNKSGYWEIQITDHGAGLDCHDDQLERQCFGLGESSAAARWDRLNEQQSYAAVRSPLRSLGVGLTTSRLFVRQFGGDVVIRNNNTNHDSSGCTVSLYLPHDDEILEPFVPSPEVDDESDDDYLAAKVNQL